MKIMFLCKEDDFRSLKSIFRRENAVEPHGYSAFLKCFD